MTRTTQLIAELDAGLSGLREMRHRVEAGVPWPVSEQFDTAPEAYWYPPEVLAHISELVERWLEEEEQQSGGEGQQGGPAPSQGSGGAQGSPQGGSQGQDRRPLTPEEAAALLEQAGDAESDIRDRMMGRTRYKDPVVEKNW